jgi:RNA polymerase sigma factor (sigma-70 family)
LHAVSLAKPKTLFGWENQLSRGGRAERQGTLQNHPSRPPSAGAAGSARFAYFPSFPAGAATPAVAALVDGARGGHGHKQTRKAGGGRRRLDLADIEPALEEENADRLLALDEALRQFEGEDARKAELVKLRFFAGLTAEQAAAALGVSTSTAEKDWAYARSWLRVAIDRISGHRP